MSRSKGDQRHEGGEVKKASHVAKSTLQKRILRDRRARDQGASKSFASRHLERKVTNACCKHSDVSLNVQRARGTSECRRAGLDSSSRRRDDRGPIQLGRGVVRRDMRGDSRGHVNNCAGGAGAGHSDSVDAVDSGRHVDGRIVGGFRRLREGKGDESEQERDNGLEGAHLGNWLCGSELVGSSALKAGDVQGM
jgi:hypothetical protein